MAKNGMLNIVDIELIKQLNLHLLSHSVTLYFTYIGDAIIFRCVWLKFGFGSYTSGHNWILSVDSPSVQSTLLACRLVCLAEPYLLFPSKHALHNLDACWQVLV